MGRLGGSMESLAMLGDGSVPLIARCIGCMLHSTSVLLRAILGGGGDGQMDWDYLRRDK